MPEENEKCCCGCGQENGIVSEQDAVDKLRKRNLISAIILLILAVVLAVWHFWGEDYVMERRYKASLEEILAEDGVDFSHIEINDGKYVVYLPNGATLTFAAVVNPEEDTYTFELEEKTVNPRLP